MRESDRLILRDRECEDEDAEMGMRRSKDRDEEKTR